MSNGNGSVMEKRLCLLFCMLGLLTMLGCDDKQPVAEVIGKDGTKYKRWLIDKWRHPSCPDVDSARVDVALGDATRRWLKVAAVPGDGDVAVHVLFVGTDGISTINGTRYSAWGFNVIQREEDLRELLDAPSNPDGVCGWVRIVEDVLINGHRYAAAKPNGQSVVVPYLWAYQGTIYAHEFGHNVGLADRPGGVDHLINIMQHDHPAGVDRQLASASEREAMEEWAGH